MKHSMIDNALFMKNRRKVFEKMANRSVSVVLSNSKMPRTGDQCFPFRQNSDLFYLTGIEQEETILIMWKGEDNTQTVEKLFIMNSSAHLQLWEGHKLTKNEAINISGISRIATLDVFEKELQMLVLSADNIYLNIPENKRQEFAVFPRDYRFAEEIRSKFPLHNYRRLAPILASCRVIKEREELQLIQKACDITQRSFEHVLQMVKPGVFEYEIEAEITYMFLKQGAVGHAFSPIVAGGKNATILHYNDNCNICMDRDLVLLDFGAEYANYSSDCSRTIPINGMFSPRQKKLYNAVLDVFKYAVTLMRPGTSINGIQELILKMWEKKHNELGLYHALDENSRTLCIKYFPHGISHFMGLDTHDVGDKDIILQPGMILTCEPGIYIPEENIGIRLENDILVTDSEPFDLMSQIPIESDHIEYLMKRI